MSGRGIRVVDSRAEMLGSGGTVVAARNLNALDKLTVARFANALWHGDEPFHVLRFDRVVWVVPHFTPGIAPLWRTLALRFGHRMIVFRATCEGLPVGWRRRVLGVLPLFPIPRLDEHPISSVPNWLETGPFAISQLQELSE